MRITKPSLATGRPDQGAWAGRPGAAALQQGLGKDAHSCNRGQGWGRGAGGDAGQGQDGAAQAEERE